MSSRPLKRTEIIGILVAVFLLGGGTGVAVTFLSSHHVLSLNEEHEFSHQYQFINPLLACGDDFSTLTTGKVNELEKKMDDSIKEHQNAGDIIDASVYYRILNGGQSFGINSNTTFAPGSLLKLPLAMSIYNASENDPGILTGKLKYTGTEVDDSQFFPPKPLTPGEYTVEQLIDQMLTNSDNDAANALATSLTNAQFRDAYTALGVTVPPTRGDDYTTTTQAYSSFFRTLYNATYLDHDNSEHILKLLSQTTFKDGIIAGVPTGTVVSHKFGERAYSNSGTLQLHDCGIVYDPNQPFIICVMTHGTNYRDMAETISDLTRLAYAYAE